jgi:type III restriction enzyme
MNLYEALAMHVAAWRQDQYRHETFSAIAEILEWAQNPDVSAFRLRAPQFRALETYWYLRLVENTPHILDLYKQIFARNTERLQALGMSHPDLIGYAADYGFGDLIKKIRQDDAFVKQYKLEAVRETIALDYPSYIFALAMGAGKTVLIGAIYATEFAMAQEYPNQKFIENALVFAPGKTIIESLRELAEMRYEAVLPPRFYKPFAAQLKLTFTRDGDPDIPIIAGSQFNVVVTNTEKIRIQKETIRKSDIGKMFSQKSEDEARTEIANLRLQRIASLPNLAIFSDEAHHTYGQAMDSDLKKVRKTVDYLHNPHADSETRGQHKTNLICVVNTTGTPYYQKQALKDVVIWYGLSEGIRDGILKELSGNIKAFDFEGNAQPYLEYVVEDFFREYGHVTLPDGAPAKLAIFFPQTEDVEELRWVVEKKMVELGYSTDLILEHHTAHEEKDEFDRFRTSPKRVALLVSRGVEGWNVPALFACALARKLQSGGNNFVLQAASRCLRQIPGNTRPARIYLSMDNRAVLDHQLQESYGEGIHELNEAQTRSMRDKIVLRKVHLPPLVIKQKVRSVVKKKRDEKGLSLAPAKGGSRKTMKMITFTLARQLSSGKVLQEAGEQVEVQSEAETMDLFSAAVELADNYHLNPMTVYQELKRAYSSDEIPLAHLDELAEQIEKQTSAYEITEETIELALALIKPEGFQKETVNGVETYTAEIQFPIDRQRLLTSYNEWKAKAGAFGFHYDPYNFDSRPEQNFFEQMLAHLNVHPDEVEDIYFTGAISDPQKTDFYVDYFGEDGRWHRYSPDFLIRRKARPEERGNGKCLIVEIKREDRRKDLTDGENGRKAMAVKKWVDLNPDLLKYEMIFTSEEEIAFDQLKTAKDFVG